MQANGRVARPNTNEIATAGTRRDITQPWVGELLIPQDSLLNTGEHYDLRQRGRFDLKLYEAVLSDDQVFSTLQQRFDALISCEWEVRAGGDRRVDQKAADFIREQLTAISFDDVTKRQLYGVFFGVAFAECLWMRDGEQIVFDDTKGGIRVRNPRRFRFGKDMQPRLLTLDNSYEGETLPERKFWWFSTGGWHHDDPYGRGLGHWLYWPVFFKRNNIKFWLIFLEKFGQPTAKGEYEQGTPKEEQAKLLAAASAIGQRTAITIPRGMMIELIEASRSGTADYQALHEAMDKAISKVVLSQTMTTDDGSSLSQAQVHEGVARRVVKADSDLICQSFNRGPVKWLTDWNYPGAAYPQVWRQTDPPEDLKEQVDRDKVLFDMGFVPSLDYVRDVYGDGFGLPDEPEQLGINAEQRQGIVEIIGLVGQGNLSVDAGRQLTMLAVPTLSEDQVSALIEEPPDPEESVEGEQGGEVGQEDEGVSSPSIDDVAAIFTEQAVEFAGKARKKRNCKKSQPCGDSCISMAKVCRKKPTEKQKSLADEIRGGGGKQGDAVTAEGKGTISQDRQKSDLLNSERESLVAAAGEDQVIAAEQNIQRILDESDQFIAVPDTALDSIIQDGRLKSSVERFDELSRDRNSPDPDPFDDIFDDFDPDFEAAQDYTNRRVSQEGFMFNGTEGMDSGQRPIYGYMGDRSNLSAGSHDGPRNYGNVSLRLKPEVRERSTVSTGDSFGGRVPSDLSQVSATSFSQETGIAGASRDFGDPDRMRGEISQLQGARNVNEYLKSSSQPYIEFQAHGQVKTSDIAEMVFYEGSRPSPSVEKWAKDNGVQITIQ